jgi:hypothetical protein
MFAPVHRVMLSSCPIALPSAPVHRISNPAIATSTRTIRIINPAVPTSNPTTPIANPIARILPKTLVFKEFFRNRDAAEEKSKGGESSWQKIKQSPSKANS